MHKRYVFYGLFMFSLIFLIGSIVDLIKGTEPFEVIPTSQVYEKESRRRIYKKDTYSYNTRYHSTYFCNFEYYTEDGKRIVNKAICDRDSYVNVGRLTTVYKTRFPSNFYLTEELAKNANIKALVASILATISLFLLSIWQRNGELGFINES